jgi:TatD DNase family protein
MVEVTVRNGEQLERALRRFKKKWERAGVLREIKRKSFYIKPLGYYISFSGNITFNNSHLPEVVKSIPLDRVMVETDSPFLSPEPERGKGNEPSRIVHTVSKLSEIYGISFEEIAKHTYDNTTELFRLP